ncbi:MAG: WD40 repeat domain-containing protein, partial [Planctomycetes bacterium]|nr:WD40 repeat domain-containing protein [Planctomycetota bacterium]
LRLDTGRVNWLCADASGRHVAIVGTGARGVQVVDIATGTAILELDGPAEVPFHESAAFGNGGSELAVIVGADRIRRHAIPSGRVIDEMVVPGAELVRVVYSLDGRRLGAVGRHSDTVRLFALDDGTQKDLRFDCHAYPRTEVPRKPSIAAIALNPDGSRLAIGTWQGLVVVRDLATGEDTRLVGHAGTTWSIVFAPDDPGLLVTSTGAGGVTFWDLDSHEACYEPDWLEGPVSQIRISTDGRSLVAFGDRGPVVVDLEYRDRHVASTLESWLQGAEQNAAAPPERIAALRAWARSVLQRPWPRFR